MQLSRKLHSGKRKYLFALMLLLFISLICLAFSMGASNGSDSSRREILLRRIGHEILLQSGDSVSRVLPIKKIGKSEYQISFDHELSFQPDSLVNTTRRSLANDLNTSDYIVNVMKCGSSSVVYGYAISRNKKDDIIACLGRKQPSACYLINIQFQLAKKNTAKNRYLLASLALLALMGFILLRHGKPRKDLSGYQSTSLQDRSARPENPSTNMFTLGSVLFDPKSRKLLINGKSIDLTGTETRVLLIFASSPNETIERSRLQKEIWEDEGVIVGRSLDMFISKLRKKLELDPNIKIVVIRGKGYKLEISC